jgi:hypothetical protein
MMASLLEEEFDTGAAHSDLVHKLQCVLNRNGLACPLLKNLGFEGPTPGRRRCGHYEILQFALVSLTSLSHHFGLLIPGRKCNMCWRNHLDHSFLLLL